jgi:hypothetical protein
MDLTSAPKWPIASSEQYQLFQFPSTCHQYDFHIIPLLFIKYRTVITNPRPSIWLARLSSVQKVPDSTTTFNIRNNKDVSV